MRHEDEVKAFFEQAGLEAQAEFADDAQRIQDAVIGAVNDWSNSFILEDDMEVWAMKRQ